MTVRRFWSWMIISWSICACADNEHGKPTPLSQLAPENEGPSGEQSIPTPNPEMPGLWDDSFTATSGNAPVNAPRFTPYVQPQPTVDLCSVTLCTAGEYLNPRSIECVAAVCNKAPECCQKDAPKWAERCAGVARQSCGAFQDHPTLAVTDAQLDKMVTREGNPRPLVQVCPPERACIPEAVFNAPKVVPVIVIPSDLQDDKKKVQEFIGISERMFEEGQNFFGAMLGRRTFSMTETAVIYSRLTNAQLSAEDTYGTVVRREVLSELGTQAQNPSRKLWIIWLGGGGIANAWGTKPGAPSTDVFAETAIVGELSIYSHLAYTSNDDTWCNKILETKARNACLNKEWIISAGEGALVHELGHTFDLFHEDDHPVPSEANVPQLSFMKAHWNFFWLRHPDTARFGLSPAYLKKVSESVYINLDLTSNGIKIQAKP